MPPLSLPDARVAVLREIQALTRRTTRLETVSLDDALNRVLADPAIADRDQPPFPRVTRDGFAVRAADVPGTLTIIGEAPPGRPFPTPLGPKQAIEIMTGAPLPAGADAVVMVEHTERPATDKVTIARSIRAGENFVPRASELRAGSEALPARRRLDPAAVALLASLGVARPRVHARPKVAIIATGDELVEVTQAPEPTQIRNSNRHGLSAQVLRAGGIPVAAPIARDDRGMLRTVIQNALPDADLLLLSGGVSMGKYDFVEGVLAELGATVIFDGVAIRPGRPLVFGRVGTVPFFGLPGNPLSTMVTFELFVRPALDVIGGADAAPLRYLRARLDGPYEQRAVPLTVFVPAVLVGERGDTAVRPLSTQGSGDLAAMARADCLMLVEPGVSSLAEGTSVAVLPK